MTDYIAHKIHKTSQNIWQNKRQYDKNSAILQFFEVVHAFKCAIFDDRDSVVTQIATIARVRVLK